MTKCLIRAIQGNNISEIEMTYVSYQQLCTITFKKIAKSYLHVHKCVINIGRTVNGVLLN